MFRLTFYINCLWDSKGEVGFKGYGQETQYHERGKKTQTKVKVVCIGRKR